jgi:hypothetical protein
MRIAILVSALSTVACGAAPKPVPPPPSAPAKAPSAALEDRSGFAQKDFELVRIGRFGVALPLPDRESWSFVDSGAWFVATHRVTSTRVRVRRFDETSLVGRRECEARAQLVGELPPPVETESRFETLVDEPLHRPAGWDGRRWVAFEPKPGGKLVGHVFLVSGRHHACLVVHVESEVLGDAQAEALADRLELFASRTIGGIVADRAKEPDPLVPEPPRGRVGP